MRRLSIFLSLALITLSAFSVSAQTETFTDSNVDYTLDLPSSAWRVVDRPDGLNQQAGFVYGDRLDGYLQVRKEVVDAGTTPADLARRDREQKLRYLPGFVEGKEETFSGRLNGVASNYEYTNAGKPMSGRIYYLLADNRTIYVLRFTGLRDRLSRIRNQTDIIGRSFRLK